MWIAYATIYSKDESTSEELHLYVWWPNISGQLEELAKACSGCQLNQKMTNGQVHIIIGPTAYAILHLQHHSIPLQTV